MLWKSAIKMDVDVKKEGFIWLSDQYYKNWEAYLNGEQVELHPTQAKFLSVFLPRGKGELVLKYRHTSTKRMILFMSLILIMVISYILVMYTSIFSFIPIH